MVNASGGSLERSLNLAAKDEADGLEDAPWPPHFRKIEGEASASRETSHNASPQFREPRIAETIAKKTSRASYNFNETICPDSETISEG
jgi:bifunctional non-homologous end joining protein LigD